MSRTHVVVSDELLDEIDRRVGPRGRSRFFEQAAKEKLERIEREAEEERSRRLVDGYRRVPQSEGRDAWGDLGAWVDTVSQRSLAAISQDEEVPW